MARITKGWARLFIVMSGMWFLLISTIVVGEYLSIKPPKIVLPITPHKSPESNTLPAYVDPTPLRESNTLPAWVNPTPIYEENTLEDHPKPKKHPDIPDWLDPTPLPKESSVPQAQVAYPKFTPFTPHASRESITQTVLDDGRILYFPQGTEAWVIQDTVKWMFVNGRLPAGAFWEWSPIDLLAPKGQ